MGTSHLTGFTRYPEYQSTEVEWIDEIPTHWKVVPGFNFLYESRDRNTGMRRRTVLSLSYGKIRIKKQDELTGLVPESFETYQLVNEGDLIFRPTDLQNDKVSLRSAISEHNGIITSAYLNLRFKENAFPKFYHYCFRAIDSNKVIYGLGSGLRQNISFLDFKRFLFPFPPLPEQTAIANLLDEKTAQIDQAIAQKERLIALLEERKQIIIQQAVTKGLDPTVEMKDSGVEWIGEVPKHWEVGKLGHFSSVSNGSTPSRAEPKYWQNGTVAWLASGKVNDPIVNEPTEYITEKAVKDCSLRVFPKDTIIMGIVGQGKTRGTTSILNIEATINQNMVGIIAKKSVNTLFLQYFFIQGYDSIRRGDGSNQEALNTEKVKNLKVVMPSLKEQTMIADYISQITKRIHDSVRLQQSQITKLKEYKATLIDSAVTGKIKVS